MIQALSYIKPYLAAQCSDNASGLPTLWRGLCKSGEITFNSAEEASGLIVANLIEIITLLSGSAAVVIIVAASIYYVTSAGDAGRVKKAKDMIVNAVVGLIISMLAYAVTEFISSGLR